MHGYVAVHVIVFPGDAPIEIQIRTAWQHEWAELFEKLADLVGRGIRYGEPPRRAWSREEFDALSATLQDVALASDRVRVAAVDHALSVAGLIAAFEEAEFLAPDPAALEEFRGGVEEGLANFRASVERLQEL